MFPLSCSNCVYFLRTDGQEGECRINPPSPVITNEKPASAFPIVQDSLWCGKFLELQNLKEEDASQSLETLEADYILQMLEFVQGLVNENIYIPVRSFSNIYELTIGSVYQRIRAGHYDTVKASIKGYLQTCIILNDSFDLKTGTPCKKKSDS